MNITSDYQQRYAELKKSLSSMLASLEEPLNRAATLLGVPRTDRLGELRGQLEKDLFSLVLIGAFQSGKSTLFNYLCDGRELSPVGPFGGGIRTSGCRVTAHPLPEGEPERAEIQWRMPGELLLSFGAPLCRYYDTSNGEALTEKEVDLHDAAQRETLSGYAWELLTSKELPLKDEERELLRFALLVCRFFPQYEQWRQQSSCRDFRDMLRLTSYPQDWASLWTVAEQTRDLSPFEGKVSFIFVGGVDLYLDSAPLRQLGCSVTDCPGLFISPWDTRIADKCIREAHAVLYLFGGQRALSQEDVKALEACMDQGGSSRLLFGANLRVSEAQWENIATQAVIPVLEQKGFREPKIHSFHSGMALRARERMAQHWGMLDANSAAAIDLDIELSQFKRRGDAAQDRTRYLNRQLTQFLSSLTNWEEDLNDYPPTDGRLEERSGVPRFICAAKDVVLERRAGSILRDQGTEALLRALRNGHRELRHRKELMEADVQAARERVTKAKEEWELLSELVAREKVLLEEELQTPTAGILRWAQDVVVGEFNHRADKVKGIIRNNLPHRGPFRTIHTEAFARDMSGVMQECLRALQRRLADETATMPELQKIREAFDYLKLRLERQARDAEHLNVPDLQTMTFPEDWGDAVALRLPPAKDLQRMLGTAVRGVNWLHSRKHIANKVWKHRAESFRDSLLQSVQDMMEEAHGPLGRIRSYQRAYVSCMEEMLDACAEMLRTEEQQLDSLQHSEERQQRAQQLGAMAESFAGYIREAENLQGEVDAWLSGEAQKKG